MPKVQEMQFCSLLDPEQIFSVIFIPGICSLWFHGVSEFKFNSRTVLAVSDVETVIELETSRKHPVGRSINSGQFVNSL